MPGRINTVATSVPSVKAATLLAASLSGSSTQPIQVTGGTADRARMSISNTSIDSRPPWLVA